MGSRKIEKKADEAVEEVDVAEVKDEAEKGDVIVAWKGRTRTYSKELHGKEAGALAKEFATKVGGKIVK